MGAYARPLKLLPLTQIISSTAEAWMLHWHLFATHIQPSGLCTAVPLSALKADTISLSMVS